MARNVLLTLFDDVDTLDFCGPLEVFAITGQRATGPVPFTVTTVAERNSPPTTTRSGLRITPSVYTTTARRLTMSWGITPLLTDRHGTTDDIVWFAVKAAREAGLIGPDSLVGVLVGSPTEPGPTTDTLRLVRVS